MPTVRIVEVGPRDGPQNEAANVPVEPKVASIEALADADLTSIEAGSFASAVAGFGSCPTAPGAPGNVATGVDVGRLCAIGDVMSVEYGRPSGLRIARSRR